MNLIVLKKSHRKPQPGDVFAYSPAKENYYFGRVIRDNAQWAKGGGPCFLCYAYDVCSDRLECVANLRRAKFLIRPFLINRLPWSRGYFVHVGELPLTKAEEQRVHVFVDTGKRYYDEFLRPVAKASKAASQAGLFSYSYFDYEISIALGLPLEPGED